LGRGEAVTLGKQVLAFSQVGKPLNEEAVAKALAKTASVLCFWLGENDPETPDPVYLEMLRVDGVVLMIKYRK
jgi:hypothetical protein